MLEYKEFKKAMTDFSLGLEEQDIDHLFKSFDKNNDGVLDLNEFMDMMLGQLQGSSLEIVTKAFEKLDIHRKSSVAYQKIKDTFDGSKHPEVCNGKKSEEEVITQFLEIYEIHHNTFNNYNRTDTVSFEEFKQFYRVISANYDDEHAFINMVKGVWGIKFENPDVADMGWAGSKDTAANHRERY
mmetsp:Transcript_21582/g.15796  ORF Transcript_21582/g.15796 Transcript_21582/m.15796 type:complete len:184 (+) Transcript_21582:2415-2966(+)